MFAGTSGAPWLNRAYAIIDECTDMSFALLSLRDAVEIDHIVYHTSRLGMSPSVDPYVVLTYPGVWIKRYVEMNYLAVDPVLREGFLRSLPFDWSELDVDDAREAGMLKDAADHGIGPYGLSIPVRNARGHRGLFSITFGGTSQQWQSFKTTNMHALTSVAYRIHGRVVGHAFGDEHKRLTRREVDCLFWVSEGKEASDIATILSISKFTVRDYLKSARFKLDCVTSTQAVSKAVKLGLLEMR